MYRCAGTLEPHIFVFLLYLLLLLLLLLPPYHVCITPSLKLSTLWQPRYNSHTATLCGPLLTMCADKNIAHACVLCLMGVCVGVCGSVDSFVSWHSKFQLSFFYLVCSVCLLLAAAAVSCRLYHTVPQALELSTLWQPRYNSSRTASVCGPLPRVCWHLHMRV